MIDIDFIRRKIYKVDESQYKIMPGDEIPLEVIDILREGKSADRAECFGAGDPKVPYTAHLYCTECNATTITHMSKQGMFEYLRGARRILCDDCKQKEKEIKEREYAKEEERRKAYWKQKDLELTEFIDRYIVPTNETFSQEELLKIYRQMEKFRYGGDEQRIKNAVTKLSYKDFLKTPYWKAVSYYSKRRVGFACQMCNSKQNLATHHKTYARHGLEHTYDGIREDLIVLCKDCHDKFHNKLAEI